MRERSTLAHELPHVLLHHVLLHHAKRPLTLLSVCSSWSARSAAVCPAASRRVTSGKANMPPAGEVQLMPGMAFKAVTRLSRRWR